MTQPIMDMPSPPQDGELPTDELAAQMTDLEHKALSIMIFRQNREILKFVRDVEGALGEMSTKGGLMGKMLGGMMPPGMGAPSNPLIMPPPPNGFKRKG